MEGMFVLADFSHLSMIGIMSNLGNMDMNSGSNLRHIDRKLSNRCHQREDSRKRFSVPYDFSCRTRCLLYCWCRDVDRWLRWCGVGPITKGRSEDQMFYICQMF